MLKCYKVLAFGLRKSEEADVYSSELLCFLVFFNLIEIVDKTHHKVVMWAFDHNHLIFFGRWILHSCQISILSTLRYFYLILLFNLQYFNFFRGWLLFWFEAHLFFPFMSIFPRFFHLTLFSLFSFRFIEQKMMSDASDMLAAALEQMDGIIAGNHIVCLDWPLHFFIFLKWAWHTIGSSHIWKPLNCRLGILRPVDSNTMCPSPSTSTCSLI